MNIRRRKKLWSRRFCPDADFIDDRNSISRMEREWKNKKPRHVDNDDQGNKTDSRDKLHLLNISTLHAD